MEFKQQFVKRFKYLYTQEEVKEKEQAFITDEQNFAIEFGWYPMLVVAANEGFLNISGSKSVVESQASEFLTFMNFWKRKSQLDAIRINQKH